MSVVAVREVKWWVLLLPGDPLKYEKWPGPLVLVPIAAELVKAAVSRPVRLAVLAVAVLATFVVALWLGPVLLVAAYAFDRWMGSRGWAASGPVGRSYRKRQVRGRLKQRWPKLMRDAEVINRDHQSPPHGPIRLTDLGVKTRVRHGIVSVTSEDLADPQSLGRIAGRLGNVYSVRVRPVNHDYSWMYVNLGDPLAGVIPWQTMPVAQFPQVTLGRSDVGPWFQPTLLGRHILIVGQSHAGKSSLMWDIIAGAEQWDTPPEWYVVDPKMGIELEAMDPSHPEAPGVAKVYTQDPKMADQIFEFLFKEAQRRGVIMRSRHLKEWAPEYAELLGPVIFGVVDEILGLPTKALKNDGYAFRLLQMGRAMGVHLLANTQLPQSSDDALGRISTMFTGQLVGATRGPGMTASAFGTHETSEAPAHKLHLPSDAGTFFSQEDGVTGYTKFKAGFVDHRRFEHVPIGQGELRRTSARVGRVLDDLTDDLMVLGGDRSWR